MPYLLSDESRGRSSGALGGALEQLMAKQCLPPRQVRRVCCATELPLRLQRLLCTVGPEQTWRAFTDGAQWWFGLGIERVSPREGPTLDFDAYFFCKDALLWAGGRWSYTSDAGLMLREIYDTTDPELGRPRAIAHCAPRHGHLQAAE